MTECPRCKQKLMLKLTMLVGATVICPNCDASLRITVAKSRPHGSNGR